MSRLFKLSTAGEYGSIAPSTGEELGQLLAKLGHEVVNDHAANPNAKVAYWGDTVAQLFYMAADAYEAGAAVTIGHNRSDQYLQAANQHRKMADELCNQARIQRDAERSASLMIAFQDGYEGLKGDRYAFESRKAFQLGQYYAEAELEMPETIKYEWVQGRDGGDRFNIDGHRYTVEYPEGKTNLPEVKLLDN